MLLHEKLHSAASNSGERNEFIQSNSNAIALARTSASPGRPTDLQPAHVINIPLGTNLASHSA